MRLDPGIAANRELIERIAAEHGALNVRVFGSRARGDARPESDVDLLVDRGPRTSSWFPAGLVLDLEQVLGFRVDVVTENAPPSGTSRDGAQRSGPPVKTDLTYSEHLEDLEGVWRVVCEEIPVLKEQVRTMVAEASPR